MHKSHGGRTRTCVPLNEVQEELVVQLRVPRAFARAPPERPVGRHADHRPQVLVYLGLHPDTRKTHGDRIRICISKCTLACRLRVASGTYGLGRYLRRAHDAPYDKRIPPIRPPYVTAAAVRAPCATW